MVDGKKKVIYTLYYVSTESLPFCSFWISTEYTRDSLLVGSWVSQKRSRSDVKEILTTPLMFPYATSSAQEPHVNELPDFVESINLLSF